MEYMPWMGAWKTPSPALDSGPGRLGWQERIDGGRKSVEVEAEGATELGGSGASMLLSVERPGSCFADLEELCREGALMSDELVDGDSIREEVEHNLETVWRSGRKRV